MHWLGRQDSNLSNWYQKPESCRWTTAQCGIHYTTLEGINAKHASDEAAAVGHSKINDEAEDLAVSQEREGVVVEGAHGGKSAQETRACHGLEGGEETMAVDKPDEVAGGNIDHHGGPREADG